MLTPMGAMPARRNRPASRWAAWVMALVVALVGGEAGAQVSIVAPDAVTEGRTATINVSVKGYIRAGSAATAGSVTLNPDASETGATHEPNDATMTGPFTFSVPANSSSTDKRAYESSGTIVVETAHDVDAENEQVQWTIDLVGGGLEVSASDSTAIAVAPDADKGIKIDDDETQSYVLALAAGAVPREGAAFDVVVRADPAPVDESKTLTLQVSDDRYALDTGAVGNQISGTLNMENPSFTTAVTPPVNDGDRVDDTLTLTAYSGTVGNATEEASRSFTVADAHALPTAAAITVAARDAAGRAVTSVPEGGAVELTISVDRGRGGTASTGEALSVALSLAPSDPAQASTYRLTPARVDLPAVMPPDGKQSASTVVRLEALADEFVNDDRLTLNLVTTGEAAYGAGLVQSRFEIEVQDTTVKKIAPKSDSAVKRAFDAARAAAAGADGLNPGEEFSVAVSELFDGIAAGNTVVYSASSSDPSVQVSASSTAVTVTAVSAGSAAVRVTARVTGSSSAVPQTRSDEAAVEQTVTVTDMPLGVELTADPPAAVEEGGAITLTATANRAVLAGEDATVHLTVVGPVVEPAPSSVTIAVGATSAAAVVTVADDDEVKDLGDVTVVATGGSLATDPTRLDVAVTENDIETVHTYTFTATAARVTEGGEIQLVVTAAPAVEEETVVSLSASPRSLAGDFTLEPSAITLAAGGTSGTAVLRATDDDEVEDTEILTLTATGPGKVLIGAVEIMLVDNDTVTYALSGPAETNLVEGRSYELQVTADATVSRDATFTIRRDRTASDAGDDDYTLAPSSIVIRAGATEGTAMLTVADDGVDEHSEALVLFVTTAEGDDVGSLAFTLWDASVPMLPLVSQLLLAAFLAIGSYRRHLRRSVRRRAFNDS